MIALKRGFTRPLRIAGIDVRLHWSVPVAALLFSRLRFEPGIWVGLLIVLLAHEFGHALLVKARGLRVVGIDILGIGGVCRFWGGTERDHVVIAWGGVLGQLVAGFVVWLLRAQFLRLGHHGAAFIEMMVDHSAAIALINLLPIPGLDGHLAWRLFSRNKQRVGWTEAAQRRTEERGTVLPIDPYRTRRPKGDIDDEPVPHNPSVQAEMERILREAMREKKRNDLN